MPVRKLIINEDRVGAIFVLEPLLHAVDLVVGNLEAGPTIPLEARGLAETAEAGDKST